MKKSVFIFAVVLMGAAGTARTAEVCERMLTLDTYPFSDPDPVPSADVRMYPYFRFDGSATCPSPHAWKAVVLENDRIRVTALPEIGGKIWGATDKLTGREFVYFNHVVKFRNIASRGPWTSGGIEFNFGLIGHSMSTSTPVDWCIRTNEDRSVSYFCSNLELINGLFWQVEVRLGDGDDFFTTRTIWSNAANVPNPYYQWMNAAFSTRGDPELAFPGSFEVGHEGDAHPWPVKDGRDVNFVNRNDFGGNKSYHVVGGDARVFGVWWKDWGLGAFHCNAFGEKYGRKAWIWALSREGAIWEDLLTDADGQYMELQSGRAFNQPRRLTYTTPFKHPTFAAGATDVFEERWGVVRDRASFEKLRDSAVSVPRAEAAPADFDWTTAYGLYVRGEQALRERDDDVADGHLRRALAKEPCFAPALDALAELDFRRGRLDEADALADKALSVNAYDPAANFWSGRVAKERDDRPKALERLGLAAYSPEFRAAAYAEMAKVQIRCGDFADALRLAGKCAEANANGIDAVCLKALSLRILGRGVEARAVTDAARAGLPLSHAVRFEAVCNGSLSREEFRAGIRGEFPHETFLGLADWYADCGRIDEARELFGWSGSPLGELAVAHLDGDVEALVRIAERSVRFVHPFRAATVRDLDWAIGRSTSWKFRYWRALVASVHGDRDLARRLLDDVTDADDAVFYVYRSRLTDDLVRALADLDSAAAQEDSWRIGKAKLERLADSGDWSRAKAVGADYLRRYPKCNALEILHARTLVALKDYRGCLDFLENVRILPSEFGDNATDSWHAAQDALGLERTWPENLGRGRPAR